jgi:hypothetical protein
MGLHGLLQDSFTFTVLNSFLTEYSVLIILKPLLIPSVNLLGLSHRSPISHCFQGSHCASSASAAILFIAPTGHRLFDVTFFRGMDAGVRL